MRKKLPRLKKAEFKDPLDYLVVQAHRKFFDYHVGYTINGQRRATNITENNLDVYRNRDIITVDQHTAGVRLLEDFTRAHIVTGYKSCLNVTIGADRKRNDASFINVEAYEDFKRALRKIPTQTDKRLIMAVCCYGEWLANIDYLRIGINRRGKVLRDNLEILIKHYGITSLRKRQRNRQA